MAPDGFNPDACTIRHLSCREWTVLKKHFIARAHDERTRLLRRCAARTVRALHLVWRDLRELYATAAQRFLARRRRWEALHQLATMTDRELRDIGISRLDIRAAAQSEAASPRGDGNPSGIRATQGSKHAESLLDRPRLCS